MAYVCYNCKRIFPSKKTNCPFCGGRVHPDEKSVSTLKNEGFTLFDIKVRLSNAATAPSDDFNIDDSAILSSLRQSYDREHRRVDRTNDNTSTNAMQVSPPQPATQSSTHIMPQTSRILDEVTPDTDDFFSQFQTSTAPATNIPTVEIPSKNNISLTSPVDDSIERELQSIERQQRRIRNNYRRLAIIHFFSNINWRIVFRIIIIAAVILGLLTIWKIRYIILYSVLNFFIALIPPIIIVWIIVSIFKSLFK